MSYISFINPEGQIERVAPDGTQRQRLSNDQQFYQFPAWSPDGRSIAAIGREQEDARVVIIDLEGEDLRTIYHSQGDTPFYLYWSPNSDYLSFLTNHSKGGLALHASEITYGTSEILALGQPFFWAWHPNDQKVLFHAGGDSIQSRVAYLHPIEGYEDQGLTAPGLFQTPGISYDGQYTAFANVAERGGSQIVIEQANRRQRIEKQHRGIATLSWSPKENRLAYISPEKEHPHFFGPLKIITAHNGQQEQIVDDTVLAFFWSPNGRYIAYFTPISPRKTITHIREGYAQGRTLIKDSPADLWLNLSIFDTHTQKNRLLTPFQPNGLFINQLVPFFDQYALSHRFWSPQSDKILLPTHIRNEPWLVSVPTNGFPPMPLAKGLMGSWSHS